MRFFLLVKVPEPFKCNLLKFDYTVLVQKKSSLLFQRVVLNVLMYQVPDLVVANFVHMKQHLIGQEHSHDD